MNEIGIDFIQYSLQVYAGMFTSCTTWGEHLALVKHVLQDTLQGHAEQFLCATWGEGDNRIAPYSHSASVIDITNTRIANVYWSDKSLDTVLVQHTGQACKRIENIMAYVDFVQPRLNRLDIALDVQTDDTPERYFKAYTGRLSKSWEESRTGQTFYLGSRKSDKLCRIYRYAPPHERAHLLRFEMQYRGEYARAIAWHIAQEGITAVMHTALAAYDLPLDGLLTDVKEELTLGKKRHGDTIAWLERAVRPALERLIMSGEFDGYNWMKGIYDGINGF